MYPYQRTPMGNPYIRPIYWVFMGTPQESLETNSSKYPTIPTVQHSYPTIRAENWGF